MHALCVYTICQAVLELELAFLTVGENIGEEKGERKVGKTDMQGVSVEWHYEPKLILIERLYVMS